MKEHFYKHKFKTGLVLRSAAMRSSHLFPRALLSKNVLFRVMLFIMSIIFSQSCSAPQYAFPVDPPAETLNQVGEEAADDPIFLRDTPIPQEWWLIFNDSQLSEFIEKTFSKNPTLQSVRLQILASAYNADIARSFLYPYISYGADVSRQKLSTTGVLPFNTGPPDSGTPIVQVPISTTNIPEYFSLYEMEINLKYSFDFWDRNRNTYRAALGKTQSDIAEDAYARLQMGILVASTYYKLQINFELEKIAQGLVNIRQEYYDLVEKRMNANIDNEIAVQSALSSLVDAKDRVLQIQKERDVSKYQLFAYMAGNFDEEISSIEIEPCILPKVPLPENLPLHLITQRPDITAQLWLIESAGRQIEVAKAGFYPDFNLAGFFGFQTIHFSQWFKWPSAFFNIDPAVTLPIFDGGKLIANLRSSEISYDLAILEYNNLVIKAAQEVLEAISVLRITWKQLEEYEKKAVAQNTSYQLTSLRVSHNLNTDLDKLTSDETRLISQNQVVVAIGETLQAILGLIKSLGGGYENCEA